MTPLMILIQVINAYLITAPTSSTLAAVIRALLEWASGVDGAAPYVFVWRPGEPSPGKNVFASFTALYAALVATQGERLVVVDTSLAPAVVPAGAFNFQGVTVQGYRQAQPPTAVTLSDGAELIDPLGFIRLQVQTQTTGPGQILFTPSNPNLGLESASIVALTPFAPIQYPAVGSPGLQIRLRLGGTLGDGANPVLDLGATGNALVFVDNTGQLSNDSVSGSPGSSLVLVYPDGAGLPQSLTGYTGTLIKSPLPELVANVIHVATNGNDFSGDGSEQRPFATVQHALDVSGDNTVIKVAPGIYPAAIVPTTPPRANLAIEGSGYCVIGSLADPIGLDLSADATSANAISSFRLSNLVLRGQTGLRVDDSNPVGDDFLQSGLFIQGCSLEGTLAACSINRPSAIAFRNNTARGSANFAQLGVGTIAENYFANEASASFDSSLPFPALGTLIFWDSNTFLDVLAVSGSGTNHFSKDNTCDSLQISPEVLAGDPMDFIFQGWARECIVIYLNTDPSPHGIVLDQAHIGFFDSFFDVTPATIRQSVSLRGAALGVANAGDWIDVDADSSSYGICASSGLPPDQGTVRRSFRENVAINVAPASVTFATPMDNDRYTVFFETAAPVAVAITAKDKFGFTYVGSAGPIAGSATIVPTDF